VRVILVPEEKEGEEGGKNFYRCKNTDGRATTGDGGGEGVEDVAKLKLVLHRFIGRGALFGNKLGVSQDTTNKPQKKKTHNQPQRSDRSFLSCPRKNGSVEK